jgi:hypothetical protein
MFLSMQKSVKHTSKTENAYFLTLTVNKWIDVFSRKNHRDTLIESFKYCQENKGLVIFSAPLDFVCWSLC